MKINVLVRVVAVISIFFSVHSIALPEISPYKGLVLAQGANEGELREQALQQVLIKVSGNIDVNKLDESKALTKHISSILSQFGYQQIGNARFYYALFDSRKINKALVDMQQPIWGETRPKPLIWLVNEDRQITSEHMINSSQDSSISWGLTKSQLTRGISAQFPLIDLDDSLAIRASDISGRFYQTIANASKRYDAEYFVLANLVKTGDGKSQLKWELVQYNAQSKKSKVLIKQTNRGSKSYVMSIMLSDIADYYAKQFAILENNGEKLTQELNVKNINSLKDLTGLNSLLDGLNAVDSFEIVYISEHQVKVSVTLKGGLMSLKNALNVQTHLQKDLSSGSTFFYKWKP
ncbi:DUF2066 domain-containing protein [Psychromonas sp. RZ22]|uniref:DUF2066 domain-containing protein n=1 Tax=Psychromonas algarum TaxID=2555643 RepID=UPI00106827B2|nr:DUF2066 domain-containing protein [Psychromonas sp. RZ22]TEW54382.1 DUF2066 domain-containing protein [Psychromonas sp. RZ22]